MFAYFFSPNYEKQAEALLHRAHRLKLERKTVDAYQAYIGAAELYEKAGEHSYQISTLQLASQTIQPIDWKRSIKIKLIIIDLYNTNGQFYQSGKIWKEIGELNEEHCHTTDAINAYTHAIEFLTSELAQHDCQTKMAILYSKDANFLPKGQSIQNYLKAYNLFEILGRTSQYNYAVHLFRALLCILATGDMVLFAQKMAEYKDIKTFSRSREYKFIEEVNTACINQDVEYFSETCYNFDLILPMDAWQLNVLLHIKQQLFDVFTEVDIS